MLFSRRRRQDAASGPRVVASVDEYDEAVERVGLDDLPRVLRHPRGDHAAVLQFKLGGVRAHGDRAGDLREVEPRLADVSRRLPHAARVK